MNITISRRKKFFFVKLTFEGSGKMRHISIEEDHKYFCYSLIIFMKFSHKRFFAHFVVFVSWIWTAVFKQIIQNRKFSAFFSYKNRKRTVHLRVKEAFINYS